MDRLEQYRKIIQDLLQDYMLGNRSDAGFETQILCDRVVARELVEMGVERSDIVLGLQPEYARIDTGYSVA